MSASPDSAGAADGTILRARGLRLGYGDVAVLDRVDLAVHAGEAWFLVGANGSGKTTLLRAFLGLLVPLGGALERHERAMHGSRIGFVPQLHRVNTTLPTTIREFVSLGFAGSWVPRAERAGRLAAALERTGLVGLERRDLASLSGGQRQRALLARALVRDPRVLVLDEPTEALDLASETAFLEALDELHRESGITLLVVTHDLEVAARHATHLALLHDGTVLAGPRDAVLDRARQDASRGIAARLRHAARHHAPPDGAG